MRSYRIAFVGFGSIATRHMRNIQSYLALHGDICTVDLYRSSLDKRIPDDLAPYVSNTYSFLDELPKGAYYDIVFVTNPTSMHYETLQKFKSCTNAFFIEKPVFDDTNINTDIFEELQGVDCYVACPLRYHPVLQYIRKNISLHDVYVTRVISSSYLPEWRPSQDYRQSYSAHRNKGGGVGIDLIHEWDYLVHFFGMPRECYSLQDKVSNLEIDSDDIAIYIAKAGKTMIEIHLDYFGRQSIRKLELFMPEDTISCDILSGTVTYLKQNREIHFDANRNKYQIKEIEHFFNIINHEIKNDNTMEHAFKVLKLAKGEL